MLSIFATIEYHQQLNEFIAQEERLNELVDVLDILENRPIPSAHRILIKNGNIALPIDWFNIQPPFILPEEIALTKANLLGVIFAKLNNYEKSFAYLQDNNRGLYNELDFINRLQQGIPIDPIELASQYSPFEEYRLMHNQAIVRHYASESDSIDIDKILYFYDEAIRCAPHEEYRAYSCRQLALLYIDLHEADKAQAVLDIIIIQDLSKEAGIEIKQTMLQVWMQQLTLPYDTALLHKLKETLWEVLQFYESSERNVESGLLLLDAAHIANISESFSESLGYVTKAIRIFEEDNMQELMGNAYIRKGALLYTWAKKGNPQFFKPAVKSYREALKVFTKERAPAYFADIQHHLANIFADMPTETKKKGLWAGVAVSSFNEALEFYTKDQYPFEYAMICNNYGNAFTKFPKAVLSDNYEKALFYYQESLDIRTSDYPNERAITLLNFLEASWSVSNSVEEFNEDRFIDMKRKAEEVKTLVREEEMLQEAQKHLDLLEELKQTVSK